MPSPEKSIKFEISPTIHQIIKIINSETLLQDPNSRDLSTNLRPVNIVDQLEGTTLRPLPLSTSSDLMRGPDGQKVEDVGLFNGEPYPLIKLKGFKGMWQEGLKPRPDGSFEVPQWGVLETDVVRGVYAGSIPSNIRVLKKVDIASSSGKLQMLLVDPHGRKI